MHSYRHCGFFPHNNSCTKVVWYNTREDIKMSERYIILNESFDVICAALDLYTNGKPIQQAFFFLNDDEREFILTGVTPEEWNDMYGEE